MSVSDVVSIKHVWVRYGGKTVLEDINFNVREKEIISIVGPNGGGKTTLLYTLMGLKKPFRGEISVMGTSGVAELPPGTVAYLPQLHHHDRSFPVNVFDVAAMSIRAMKKPGQRLSGSDREALDAALAMVDMKAFRQHHFGTLSGGQQQRILIARALAVKPVLLIMDEPSTGLDAVAQDSFYRLLQQLRDEEGLTIIFVSHDVGTVSAMVDTVACLNRKIHFHGNPQDGIPSAAREAVFGTGINFLIHDEQCKTCRGRV